MFECVTIRAHHTYTWLTLCKYGTTLHCRTHYAIEDSLGEETHVVLSYLFKHGERKYWFF